MDVKAWQPAHRPPKQKSPQTRSGEDFGGYLPTNKQQVHSMLKGENQPGGERVLALLEWLEKHGQAVQPTAATT